MHYDEARGNNSTSVISHVTHSRPAADGAGCLASSSQQPSIDRLMKVAPSITVPMCHQELSHTADLVPDRLGDVQAMGAAA